MIYHDDLLEYAERFRPRKTGVLEGLTEMLEGYNWKVRSDGYRANEERMQRQYRAEQARQVAEIQQNLNDMGEYARKNLNK